MSLAPDDPPLLAATATPEEQIDRLRQAIDHLFPGHSGPPVEVAIGIMTQYALDLVTQGHLVEFTERSWAVRHPLPCRPTMLSCPVHLAMTEVSKMPSAPVDSEGIYDVVLNEDGSLTFTPYEEPQEGLQAPEAGTEG